MVTPRKRKYNSMSAAECANALGIDMWARIYRQMVEINHDKGESKKLDFMIREGIKELDLPEYVELADRATKSVKQFNVTNNTQNNLIAGPKDRNALDNIVIVEAAPALPPPAVVEEDSDGDDV